MSVLQKITPRPGNRERISISATMVLRLWKTLFGNMHARPTHLRNLLLHPPKWFGVNGACNYALGGVFFNNAGGVSVW